MLVEKLWILTRCDCLVRYNALDIRHAAIANFNCVAVEYFVQTTCRWEVFIEKLQEIPRDVGFNGFAERGVEPNVSLAPSFQPTFQSVKTNIARNFLQLLDKHFPPIQVVCTKYSTTTQLKLAIAACL